MDKMNYTKGKWEVSKSTNKDYPLYVIADMERKPKGIALIKNYHPYSDEMEANAQLIASAPDLYEILHKWQNGGFSSQIEFANAVRKALAKAEEK